MLATLSLASESWWLWTGLLVIAGAGLLGWAYRVRAVAVRIRIVARGLKFLALLLLALALLEPVWSGTQPKPRANLFFALVDNSQSLSVHTGASRCLADELRDVVAPKSESSWLTRLEQDFEFQRFLFDRRVRQVPNFSTLDSSGERSALKAALKELAQRYRGRPVGGLVLLSDGAATDLTEADVAALAIECKTLGPIYPVLLPGETARLDVAIENVAMSETSFEDAPITVQCDVRARSWPPGGKHQLLCRLVDPQGKLIEEQRQAPVATGERTPFRFQLRPTARGIAFYTLDVSAESSGAEASPLDEVTQANNRRLIAVDRGATPHRVLYLSGRPNWEFKFLRRAVEDDDLVDLVGVIRIAKREAKFEFRGRDGQSSNALFRGFKPDADADTERYDEPVFVRLNTKTPDELRAGFPKTADELFPFDAVILDDIEASFFTRDQLTLLERFVSERGGGLLMLGGPESFQSGGYERTPVADVLPVYMDRAAYPDEDVVLKLDLTTEGWLQPWIRLRATEDTERERLRQMPGFRAINPARGVKPGASILATMSDPSGKRWPALVTQQYGRGHAGAVLIGDLWRWQLLPSHPPLVIKADAPQPGAKRNDGDLAKAWRQTVRWLVADVASRVSLKVEPAPDVSADAVRLRVRAVDQEFHPLDNARVTVQVTQGASIPHDEQTPAIPSTAEPVAAPIVTLAAESSDQEPGVYTTVFVPRQVGGYQFAAQVVDGEGRALPAVEVGVVHDPLSEEFRSVGVNRALLEKLAVATGGKLIRSSELNDFVGDLRSQKMPVMETWSMSLWDRPFVFVIVLACLIGEWTLRRLGGLA